MDLNSKPNNPDPTPPEGSGNDLLIPSPAAWGNSVFRKTDALGQTVTEQIICTIPSPTAVSIGAAGEIYILAKLSCYYQQPDQPLYCVINGELKKVATNCGFREPEASFSNRGQQVIFMTRNYEEFAVLELSQDRVSGFKNYQTELKGEWQGVSMASQQVFVPEPGLVAFFPDDYRNYFFEVRHGELIAQELPKSLCDGTLIALDYHQGHKYGVLATATPQARNWIVDFSGGESQKVGLLGITSYPVVAFSKSGEILAAYPFASLRENQVEVQLEDNGFYKKILSLQIEKNQKILGIALSPDGNTLAVNTELQEAKGNSRKYESRILVYSLVEAKLQSQAGTNSAPLILDYYPGFKVSCLAIGADRNIVFGQSGNAGKIAQLRF